MEHYNVIIMTPGYSMESQYVISLLNTIRVLENQKISWAFSNVGTSDVSIARENTILGRSGFGINQNYASPLSGAATYDKLFLIDSDIFWEVEDFLRLYHSSYDLTSGIYLQSDGETTTVLTKTVEPTSTKTFTTGLQALHRDDITHRLSPFQVSGAGLGFMCVKSGVFEAIERPWFEHEIIKKPVSEMESVVEMLSEDVSFIRKAIKAGFKVYADPSVKVGHTKKANIHWY